LIFSEDRAIYEIMWKNMVQLERIIKEEKYGACCGLHAE
jgi:hypothetical protein